jgi:hypothetical protein
MGVNNFFVKFLGASDEIIFSQQIVSAASSSANQVPPDHPPYSQAIKKGEELRPRRFFPCLNLIMLPVNFKTARYFAI